MKKKKKKDSKLEVGIKERDMFNIGYVSLKYIQFMVYHSNSYSSADNETYRPISWTKANCRSKWELI